MYLTTNILQIKASTKNGGFFYWKKCNFVKTIHQMNPSLFSFYPKFLLSEKTGNDKTPALQVFDETPYVANGIDLDAVAGVILSAKRENTSFYANTDFDNPDVTLDPVLNEKVDLPVDTNDDALYGDYEFTYKVRVTNEIIGVDGATTAPGAATFSSLFYEGAVIADFVTKVNQLVTYLGSNFIIQFINASNVVVGQSVVTGAENDGGDLVVSFTEVTDADYATITKMRFLTYYSDTVNVSYCAQDWPTGVLVVTGNCLTAQISVQDQTQYQASDTLSRTMVLNYPILANGTPVETAETTSTASMLIGPNIWTGNYTAALTSVLTREQTDTLVLQYSVIKYTYFLLECDAGLCCMRSCIDNVFNSYKSALQVGSANLSILRDNIITIMGYVNLYGIAVNCGNTQAASDYLSALQAYMDSIGCDCDCSDSPTNGEPTIVYPLFSSPQPNYIPISYLEINDIVTNSNSKVPSNKAVINYIGALLEEYYTITQIDDGFYSKAESNSNFVAKNYKEYMAVFSQVSSNPTIDYVLVNDFGASIDASSFIKGGFDGVYGVVAASGTPFTANKTFAQVAFGEPKQGNDACGIYWVDNTSLSFWSKRDLTGTDALFTKATIYIRVYN